MKKLYPITFFASAGFSLLAAWLFTKILHQGNFFNLNLWTLQYALFAITGSLFYVLGKLSQPALVTVAVVVSLISAFGLQNTLSFHPFTGFGGTFVLLALINISLAMLVKFFWVQASIKYMRVLIFTLGVALVYAAVLSLGQLVLVDVKQLSFTGFLLRGVPMFMAIGTGLNLAEMLVRLLTAKQHYLPKTTDNDQ